MYINPRNQDNVGDMVRRSAAKGLKAVMAKATPESGSKQPTASVNNTTNTPSTNSPTNRAYSPARKFSGFEGF